MHFHVLALDGVYVRYARDALVFHTLPTPTHSEADNLVSSIATPGINQLGYTYDANKRALQESNPLLASEALSYGYDSEDRLIDWKRGLVGTPLQTQSWNLSLVGDWQSTTRDGVQETRTHNPVHEILSLTKPS